MNSMTEEFVIRLSYVELYNEELKDLLGIGTETLKIVDVPMLGPQIIGVTEHGFTTPVNAKMLLAEGEKKRHVGVTNMNLHSSRSHVLVRLCIEIRRVDSTTTPLRQSWGNDGPTMMSVLNFVDLAGSERASRTNIGSSRDTLKEGGYINKSLLHLGNVIASLSEGTQGQHVTYRNSKLTRLLSSALGGNAKCYIITCISSSSDNLSESLSSLRFSSRAKKVVNQVQPCNIVDLKSLQTKLALQQLEIDELRNSLSHNQNSDSQMMYKKRIFFIIKMYLQFQYILAYSPIIIRSLKKAGHLILSNQVKEDVKGAILSVKDVTELFESLSYIVNHYLSDDVKLTNSVNNMIKSFSTDNEDAFLSTCSQENSLSPFSQKSNLFTFTSSTENTPLNSPSLKLNANKSNQMRLKIDTNFENESKFSDAFILNINSLENFNTTNQGNEEKYSYFDLYHGLNFEIEELSEKLEAMTMLKEETRQEAIETIIALNQDNFDLLIHENNHRIDLEKLQNEIHNHKSTINELMKNIDSLENNHTNSENDAKNQIDTLNSLVLDLENKLSEKDEEIKLVNSTSYKLELEIFSNNEKLKQYENIASTEKMELKSQIQSIVERHDSEALQLKSENESLEKLVQSMQCVIDNNQIDHENKIADYESKLIEAEHIRDNQDIEFNDLLEKYNELINHNSMLTNNQSIFETRLHEIENLNSNQENQNMELTVRFDDLLQDHNKLLIKYETLQRNNQNLKLELESMHDVNVTLVNITKDNDSEGKLLKDSYDVLDSQLKLLNEKYEHQVKLNHNLSESNNERMKQKDNLLQDHDIQYNTLKTNFENLQNQYNDISNQFKALQMDYSQLENDFDVLKGFNNDLGVSLDKFIEEKVKMQEKLDELNQSYIILEKDSENLKLIHQSTEVSRNEILNQYNDKCHVFNELSVKYDELFNLHNDLLTVKEKLVNEFQKSQIESRSKYDELLIVNSGLDSKLSDLSAAYENVTNNVNKFKSSLGDKEAENSELNHKFLILNDDHEKLIGKYTELRNDYSKLTIQLDYVNADSIRLNSELNDIKVQNTEVDNVNNTLQSELADITDKYNELLTSYHELDEEKDKLTSLVDLKSNDYNNLNEEYNKLLNEINSIENMYETLESSYKSNYKELQDLSGVHNILCSEKQELLDNVNQLKEAKEELLNELDRCKQTLSEVSSESIELKTSSIELEHRIQELQLEKANLMENLNNMTQQYDRGVSLYQKDYDDIKAQLEYKILEVSEAKHTIESLTMIFEDQESHLLSSIEIIKTDSKQVQDDLNKRISEIETSKSDCEVKLAELNKMYLDKINEIEVLEESYERQINDLMISMNSIKDDYELLLHTNTNLSLTCDEQNEDFMLLQSKFDALSDKYSILENNNQKLENRYESLMQERILLEKQISFELNPEIKSLNDKNSHLLLKYNEIETFHDNLATECEKLKALNAKSENDLASHKNKVAELNEVIEKDKIYHENEMMRIQNQYNRNELISKIELKNLDIKYQNLLEYSSKLKDQTDQLNSKVLLLESNETDLVKEKHRNLLRVKDIENEIKSNQQKYEMLFSDYSNLQDSLINSKVSNTIEYETLNNQYKQINSEYMIMQSEYNTMMISHNRLLQQHDHSMTTINDLSTQIANLKFENFEMKSKISDLNQEVVEKQENINHLQKNEELSNKKFNELISQYEAMNSLTKSQYDELKSRFAVLSDSKNEVEGVNKSLNNDVAALTEKYDLLLLKYGNVNDSNNDLIKQLNETKLDVVGFQEVNSKLINELNHHQDHNNDLQRNITELNKMLTSVNQSSDDLMHKHQSLLQDYDSIKEKYNYVNTKLSIKNEEDIDRYIDKYATLLVNEKNYENEIRNSNTMFEKLKFDYSRLEQTKDQEIQEYKEKVDKLLDAIKELRSVNESLKAKETANASINALTDSFNKLKNESESMKSQLEQEASVLKVENNNLKYQLEYLESKLRNQKEADERKLIDSVSDIYSPYTE